MHLYFCFHILIYRTYFGLRLVIPFGIVIFGGFCNTFVISFDGFILSRFRLWCSRIFVVNFLFPEVHIWPSWLFIVGFWNIYFVFLSIWSRRVSSSLFHMNIHWAATKGIFLAFLWGLYSSGGSFPLYTLCTFMEGVPLYIIMEGIPFDFIDKLHDY